MRPSLFMAIAWSVWVAAIGSAAAQAPATGGAPGYPAKPIRVINPYTPGGGIDAILRPLAQKMSENMKQPLVVDYRTGANGMIGLSAGAKSLPDGYTLVVGTTSALTMNPAVYSKVPYDSIRDFAPISNFAEAAFMLTAHPSVPAKNVKELIALARARPKEVTYASFGVGSINHFGTELFSAMTGIKMLNVPYKGTSPAIADLIAGHVMLIFESVQATVPHIRANRLRALGLAGAKRSAAAPDIPTIAESGVPGFELVSWYALLAPANTPRDIVTKLHGEIVKGLAASEVRERFESFGTEPVGSTPEALAAQIKSDLVKWEKVARTANIRAD
ncbi:MAG TPA: tripartite tricarboxylate transporter substrate binding protein [Burkholderiales bacterium]|nr:tripartite tricarboxylate transporter substrate binding protein [Burkholderiales bacterium]